jgi:hypothetical protein
MLRIILSIFAICAYTAALGDELGKAHQECGQMITSRVCGPQYGECKLTYSDPNCNAIETSYRHHAMQAAQAQSDARKALRGEQREAFKAREDDAHAHVKAVLDSINEQK